MSNGSASQLFGDGRSAGARRHKDLLREFADEVDGMAHLAQSDRVTVQRLATLCVEAEIMEAQRAQGMALDAIRFTTLVNAQRRTLKDFAAIKRRIGEEADAPSLAAYLAQKQSPASGAPDARDDA